MVPRHIFLGTLFTYCFAVPAWLIARAAIALSGESPINQPAPDLTLLTNTGNGKSLSDLRDKWVVFYFYPKDFTTGCTLEAHRFQQDLPKYLSKNTEIIGVSADAIDSQAEFCDREKLPETAATHASLTALAP